MERHSFYADDAGQGVSNKKYWSTTHNIGIEVPKTVEDALDINRKTGTDFWKKAIRLVPAQDVHFFYTLSHFSAP